jgi:hypothetical protein
MAASYRIPAVEKFDFAKPEEWPRWIRRFERFRQASDLATKSEEAQISTLVYSMGDKAEDILTSFNLKDDELKVYATVKGKFENYFVKRRNTIYERARFNRRSQGERKRGRVYRRSISPRRKLWIRNSAQRTSARPNCGWHQGQQTVRETSARSCPHSRQLHYKGAAERIREEAARRCQGRSRR